MAVFFFFFNILILERKEGWERETLICFTYLHIHGLIFVCALNKAGTCNLGVVIFPF